MVNQDDEKEVNINNIGQKVQESGVETWNNEFFIVVWVVRWTAKGLQPVKPCVHLRAELVLPPGRALMCK